MPPACPLPVQGFNPRTPCGVRLHGCNGMIHKHQFQSTHSLRSATATPGNENTKPIVSIHALLAECDHCPFPGNNHQRGFNPRTPCGVRLQRKRKGLPPRSFNPRTPCGVRLSQFAMIANFFRVSIHALLAECDRLGPTAASAMMGFNPRTPCGVRQISLCTMLPLPKFQSTHSLRSATQPTLYITTQQSKSYFAPTSLKRPSLHGYTF